MRVAAELKQHREDTAKQFNRIEQSQIQSTLKVELEFVKDDIKALGCRHLPQTATQDRKDLCQELLEDEQTIREELKDVRERRKMLEQKK